VAGHDGKIRKQWGLKNDYIAVCVTGFGMAKEKILGDIPISKGTGELIAKAVWKLFTEWGIISRIFGLGFDTTSTNTGCDLGKKEN
jgi:hypothetical protein